MRDVLKGETLADRMKAWEWYGVVIRDPKVLERDARLAEGKPEALVVLEGLLAFGA